MYYVYVTSGTSLLIKSTDSMIHIGVYLTKSMLSQNNWMSPGAVRDA